MRPSRRRLRWLVIVYGISLFFWLSVEDVTIGPVVFLGLGAAFLIIALTTIDKLVKLRSVDRYLPPIGALLGGLMGALTSIAVITLMFFKNARHGHIFPDYPPSVMLAILQRAPIWAVGGSLIGLSVGLGWLAWRGQREIAQSSS